MYQADKPAFVLLVIATALALVTLTLKMLTIETSLHRIKRTNRIQN